jgi:hypothetical protein
MRHRTILIAVALAVAVVLLAWRTSPRSPDAGGAGGGEPTAAGADPRGRPGRPALSGATERATGEPQILAVEFDKPRLCANDDVLVTVDAVDAEGERGFLVPRITFPGHVTEGFRAVGRVGVAFADDRSRRESVQVELLDVRTREVVASREAPLVIEDCRATGAGVRVACVASEGHEDEMVCTASLWADDFAAVAWDWRLVDETAAAVTTRSPWLRQRLPQRLQTASVDSYVIEVRARDATGREVAGRGSFAQHNARWDTAAMAGLLQLPATFDPIPRERDGSVITHVVLRNPFEEPIELDGVAVTRYPCAAGPEADLAAEPPLAAAALIGAGRLGPGETIEFDWRLPADPARCAARAELQGSGADSGLPAVATWLLPTDPRARTAVSGDGARRVQLAMYILSERRGHRVDTISAIELADLEREGLLPGTESVVP